jgi:hypothetical protein
METMKKSRALSSPYIIRKTITLGNLFETLQEDFT